MTLFTVITQSRHNGRRDPHNFYRWGNVEAGNRAAYEDVGVSVREAGCGSDGRIDIGSALEALACDGITRLMVEGGGRLISALLKEDFVDRVIWFRAPTVIGGDGVSVASAFGVRELDEAANFVKVSTRPAGDDLVETYMRGG